MNHFLIGQYGGFDFNKYRRDFREGFYGIEACLFSSDADSSSLIEESRSKGFHVGVHFPFHAGGSYRRDALFLSQNETTRNNAFQYIQEELDKLVAIQPSYILFHYPKPVILDDRVDWTNWRFADRSEYIYENEITLEELIEKSEYLFRWLSVQGNRYDFVPILEFDALNRYIYETDFLVELLHKYPSIRLCLDTGRLFLQEKIDPFFNSRQIIRKYAKYAAMVHLWNVQVKESVQNNHYPVLPEQNPDDGWAPIEDYLKIIRDENKHVRILFEHRSDLISDEQLERCYLWVDSILNGI